MAAGNSPIYIICKTQSTCQKLCFHLDKKWQVEILPVVNVRIKRLFKGKGVLIAEELLYLCRLFLKFRFLSSGANIACASHHYSTLLFGRIMSFFGVKHRIYLFNFYIHGLGEKRFIQKILRFLLRQNVGILAQSKTEITYFKKLCPSIDSSYFPYCSNEITGYSRTKKKGENYFFAGGYTNRDYKLLISCAERLPQQKFIIVCSHLNALPSRIPENVTIFKELSKNEFHSLMAGSQAVVLPLKNNVGSSGQMVALAGMQMEKVVIYPEFDVVSQYFEDKVNGVMYLAGNQDSMMKALQFVIEKSELLSTMGKRARKQWDSCYRRENFISAVCERIDLFFNKQPAQR